VFDRIAVISRGEPAMRLTRAFCETDDEAVLLRKTGAGDPYLDDGEPTRVLPASGAPTGADPRVWQLEAAVNAGDGVEQAHLRVQLATRRGSVRS
jgi:hypothetical protein